MAENEQTKKPLKDKVIDGYKAHVEKAITKEDKKTVSQIDKAIRALKDKTKETKDEKTKIVLQERIEKLTKQKAKTIMLYNKMKKRKSGFLLRSMSVSNLSVKKIYEVLGRKTAETNAFFANFSQHPIENSVLTLGITLITANALTVGNGAVPNAIGTALKTIWNSAIETGTMGFLIGGFAVGAAIIMKAIKIKKQKEAIAKKIEEDASKKGSNYDFDSLSSNLKTVKTKLANEAAMDPDIIKHLQEVAMNPYNPANIRTNAMDIIKEATKKIHENKTKLAKDRVKADFETTLASDIAKIKPIDLPAANQSEAETYYNNQQLVEKYTRLKDIEAKITENETNITKNKKSLYKDDKTNESTIAQLEGAIRTAEQENERLKKEQTEIHEFLLINGYITKDGDKLKFDGLENKYKSAKTAVDAVKDESTKNKYMAFAKAKNSKKQIIIKELIALGYLAKEDPTPEELNNAMSAAKEIGITELLDEAIKAKEAEKQQASGN